MIRIQIQKNKDERIDSIDVLGHADYAEFGEDIVCAAVSTLLQVVGYTLLDHKELDAFVGFKESGFGVIRLEHPTEKSHLIMSVFEKGATLLAEQYPEHVMMKYMSAEVS